MEDIKSLNKIQHSFHMNRLVNSKSESKYYNEKSRTKKEGNRELSHMNISKKKIKPSISGKNQYEYFQNLKQQSNK